MSMDYNSFVAVDLETTGLESNAEVIEVGLAIVENGSVVREWSTLIKPSKPIPNDITSLTGITNAMVQDAPSWEDVEDEVLSYLDGQLLLAHNHQFDKGRLEFELGKALPNDWLDTHDLSKLFLPTLSSYKLMSIATHLHIPDTSHHRALNDAIVCAKVYLRLLQDALKIDPFTLHEMAMTFSGEQTTLFHTGYELGDLLYQLAGEASAADGTTFPEWYEEELLESEGPKITFNHAEDFFAENGLLAQEKADFQYRPQQLEMLECIKNAFDEDKHALIEAGTGTGKSFAYLVPSLLWSYENDARVVIATGTITLQEQLFHTDLPFLKQVLDFPFSTAIAKGRSNYLCLRRFQDYTRQAPDTSWQERLFAASLVMWRDNDPTGDREHLNLNKSENQYWQNIASAPDTCLGKRCRHFSDCCYFRNKRQCEQSNVIITNHALLFQDLRLGSLLPEYDRVVIDEAHHIEDEATHQFTDTIDFELMQKMLANCSRTNGFFNRVAVALGKANTLAENAGEISTRLTRAREDVIECNEIVEACIRQANDIPELTNIGELRITDKIRNSEWWGLLEESLRKSHRALATTVTSLSRLLNAIGEEETLEALIREMTHCRDRLGEQRDWLERFVAGLDENFVYWVKTYKNYNYANLLLSAAYIDIMPLIHEKLFEKKTTAVLTSATLAVNKNLDYTREKYLLSKDECLSSINEAPFDYMHQSVIAIPNDHKDYSKTSDFEYTKNVISDLKKLIPAVDGDMLVLFTSYAMLNKVQRALKDDPSLKGYRILAHGQDGSRTSLLEAIQDEGKTVLLGANSFWEGVDIKGDKLRTVVITKLPFVPPTMPVESARNELLQAQGKSAFAANSLPQAVLRFRQGCGRLIRSNTDYGSIIILDNRVIKKSYGATFLRSLPEQPTWIDGIDKLTAQLHEWHKRH